MRTLALFFFLASFVPAAARCEQGGAPWGAQVSRDYNAWGWISAYTGEDEGSWDSLPSAERGAILKKAAAACAAAGRDLDSAGALTDGDALLAMPAASVKRMAACESGGPGAAAGLAEKQKRLALIKQKSAAGRFDQEDADWLAENGLTLRQDPDQAKAAARESKQRAARQQKGSEAAAKKYSGLNKKGLDSAALSKVYDGGAAGGAGAGDAVALSGKHKSSLPEPGERVSRKKLSYTPPPEMQLTDEFKGMKGYDDMKKENEYNKVMNEVDKDGADAAAKNKKIKTAGYASLKAVYSVSKDFDETFVNNPSPKSEDVKKVIDRINSKARNPQEAWEIAYQMRNKRDFPALRDAEHYLWACSESSESRWKAARTMITTPMYSAAKLPGLRKLFFDDNTSPPSASEIKWGWKGVKDCVK